MLDGVQGSFSHSATKKAGVLRIIFANCARAGLEKEVRDNSKF